MYLKKAKKAGPGSPYYVEGSAGRGRNPSPFPDRPWVAVLVGIAAMAIGATCTWFADIPARPAVYGIAFGLGLLAVAMIHAQLDGRSLAEASRRLTFVQDDVATGRALSRYG